MELGSLIVEYRGVYLVGHRPRAPESLHAAVKACGEGALLCGLAAAWPWGLIRGPAPRPEVTAPTERRINGITTHRRRRMHSKDSTEWKRIPITSVPATLIALPSRAAPTTLTATGPLTT